MERKIGEIFEYKVAWLFHSLPKGSIKKLIGRELSWEDNPVELKEEQP